MNGSFTVLEGPVIDTDGTILRFAADFRYSCPQTSGREVRGWIRFHSDLPRPAPETMDYRIDVDTGSAAQVGETITLTPIVTGLDFYDAVRCTMFIESINPLPWVRMQVASDNCEAWTLVVPPAAAGNYRISGSLFFMNASSPSYRAGPELGLEITAGTAMPFVTNYPVQSWDPVALIGDPTPSFGSSMTVQPADDVDGCRLAVDAGMEQAVTYQRGGCQPWTLTLPAPSPDVAESFFLDRTAVRVITWEGESSWAIQNPEAPLVGTRYGETYHASLPLLDGVGGAYSSDLPAIFSGSARGNVYYSDDPTSHAFAPVVIGADTGTCTSTLAPTTRTVTDGACGPFIVPPSGAPGNSGARYAVELRDDLGVVIAESSTDIGFVGRLGALDIDVPNTVTVGAVIPIDVTSSTGAPATYELVLTPVAGGAGSVLAADATYRGDLSPSIGSGDGASVTIEAASLTLGAWDVRATFTDVFGGTSTASVRLNVVPADSVPPTATAPRRGFVTRVALASGAIQTRIPWSGSDVGSGIARYELHQQTNGGTWSTVSTMLTSPSVTRALATEKTYRFRVRAVDKAGNSGAWAYGDPFRVSRISETNTRIAYSGTWATSTATAFWGGQVKASSRASSRATMTFTGRSVAWIASMGPTRGKADVYVNGSKVATVDLYSATSKHQQVVWTGSWTTSASRTVSIRVLGTSGRPRVDIDAFVTAN